MNQATALQNLIRTLEELRVRYLVGGSLASSSRGIPRATMDADLLVGLFPAQTALLAKGLGSDWYIDADFAGDAVQHGRAFNVIHIPSGHKFDLFPAVDAFHLSELERADIKNLSVQGGSVPCLIASAEDMVLAKLRWYRDGGETSERQWSDITDMLVTNPDRDSDYLASWARKLGVADLLDRAIKMTDEPI